MVLSFAACSNSNNAGQTTTDQPQASSADISTVPTEYTDTSNGKVLTVYFTAAGNSDVGAVPSASVVTVNGYLSGGTQALAQMI